MYTKRIQLVNYGPIERLNIALPFEGDTPKPVVLVGENGSGKSIFLSHIVNGLVAAKDIIYPETPEVETDKVYKLRASSYIKSGCEYYFGQVEFEGGLLVTEMRSRRLKREYDAKLPGLSGSDVQGVWDKMQPEENDYFESGFSIADENRFKDIIAKNCVLYFPPNRFEEPAWLNEENLKAQAQYMGLKRIQGYTSRKVMDYSPLHDNQNWLFEVIYDRAAFEVQTRPVNFPSNEGNATFPLLFSGYSGQATRTYETALQIVRAVTKRDDVRFGIGRRRNRVVSIQSATGQLVPNVFQLSSGETSLLNLFLSILRDFDLCGAPFSIAEDIRGIVVIDEIDLHLHAVHQHEVLPSLIKMFPKVQFIVTTHSPLFVLGMQRAFGENGFSLYRLPQGQQISSEEFSEFGDAYRTFSSTRRFFDDIHMAIKEAQKPVLLTEGEIDQKYLKRAYELLGKQTLLESVDIKDGGGRGNLANVWKHYRYPVTDLISQKVLLLFDCDKNRPNENQGNLFQRTVPLQSDNPVEKGIENLFSKTTLERASQHKPAFIDIEHEHRGIERGVEITIPERWAVNSNEKMNLCDWLCENGTQEDFRHFQVIFDLVEEVIGPTPSGAAESESEAS